MANYSKIKTFDIANGEGIRTSIFFSGCNFGCKGCFNSETWDFNAGEPFTLEVYETKIKPTITEHIAGIGILGGEPLHPKNLKDVSNLVIWFKKDFPNKNIWLWSGSTWEELIERAIHDYANSRYLTTILVNIDVLVDGQFVEEQKDLTLPWSGSRNQRVINVPETLTKKQIVLYN